MQIYCLRMYTILVSINILIEMSKALHNKYLSTNSIVLVGKYNYRRL
jgi:hypothetical protein